MCTFAPSKASFFSLKMRWMPNDILPSPEQCHFEDENSQQFPKKAFLEKQLSHASLLREKALQA